MNRKNSSSSTSFILILLTTLILHTPATISMEQQKDTVWWHGFWYGASIATLCCSVIGLWWYKNYTARISTQIVETEKEAHALRTTVTRIGLQNGLTRLQGLAQAAQQLTAHGAQPPARPHHRRQNDMQNGMWDELGAAFERENAAKQGAQQPTAQAPQPRRTTFDRIREMRAHEKAAAQREQRSSLADFEPQQGALP